MSLFDEKNNEVSENMSGEWAMFLKLILGCGVLSMLIAALSMPAGTSENIIQMAVFIVMISIVIMFLPLLIGLISALLKLNKNFAFLVSWVVIAGLFLLGSMANKSF